MIWQIYITGITILVVAIIANAVAQMASLTTWYGYIESIISQGFLNAMKKETILSLVFLFFLYPLILGMAGFFLIKWFQS